MKRNIFVLALAAGLVVLGSAAKVQAWGAAHVGYTHVGPSGVQHYGATAARGPSGSYSGSHYGAYGAGGSSYHAGYSSESHYGGSSYGGYHSYSPSYSGGYAAGGYHYGSSGGYSAGVYRAY
jgi:hypothetical protein